MDDKEQKYVGLARPLLDDEDSSPARSTPPVVHPPLNQTKPDAPELAMPEVITGEAKVPEGYTRVGLPSGNVPYDFDDVFVRKFEVEDLIGLADARNGGNVLTDMIDVMDRCVYEISLRDFTPPDHKFLMYWWRINSFTRSPYTLDWLSRYTNTNKLVVGGAQQMGMHVRSDQYVNLKRQIVSLGMTREQYAHWKQKGLRFPTLRDAEMLEGDMTPGVRFAMENAQYVAVDPNKIKEAGGLAAAQIAAFKKGGIDMMTDIKEFAELITHGIDESIEFADAHFEPNKAIQALRRQALTLNVLAHTGQQQDNGEPVDLGIIQDYIALAQEYSEEANEIEKKLENGEKPEPRKEVVTLRINVTSFFP